MKLSAKDKIVKILISHKYVAIHEFRQIWEKEYYEGFGASDNNIGSRLPEMARSGHEYQGARYFLEGRKRMNQPYSEWWIERNEPISSTMPEIEQESPILEVQSPNKDKSTGNDKNEQMEMFR